MAYGYKGYIQVSGQELNQSFNISDEDASRYENLLSELDDEEFEDDVDASATRHKKELASREEKVHELAVVYGTFLGMDFNTPSGKAWLERTVKFYSGSETLYQGFLVTTETARKLAEKAA